MAESIQIPEHLTGKKEMYESLLPQIKALVDGETDLIANLANIIAALHHGMNFFWTGIYFVKGKDLVLGPFQGTVACVRIALGKGVCGACWQKSETIIVPDVDRFPGHIACSTESKSEIAVPVFSNGNVVAVLDVDSDTLSTFDDTDALYLGEISKLAEALWQ